MPWQTVLDHIHASWGMRAGCFFVVFVHIIGLTESREYAVKRIVAIGLLAALGGCASWESAPTPPPSTPIFFKPQSAALDQNALLAISVVAKAANAKPDAPVIVVGTSENKGDTALSEALSEKRAQTVAVQLEADGVQKDRLRVYGAGAVDMPKGLNAAQGARRVLISIGN